MQKKRCKVCPSVIFWSWTLTRASSPYDFLSFSFNAEITSLLVFLTFDPNGRPKYFREDDAEIVFGPTLIVTEGCWDEPKTRSSVLQGTNYTIVGDGMPNMPKDKVSGPFNYAEQNGCLRIEWAWEKGYLPSNLLLLLKRAPDTCTVIGVQGREFTFIYLKMMFWSWEGMEVLKDIISRTFNYTEQNGYIKILIRCVLGIDGRGELVDLESLIDLQSTVKNGAGPFDFQPNKLLLKFLRQEIGGIVILKDIISGLFNYAEQNCYLKILIGCVWGNGKRGRGIFALQHLSTIKNGTGPFSF